MLRYDWQPGRIDVIERSHKKGHAATLAYTLVSERRADQLWIQYVDMHFLEFDGRKADEPGLREQLEPIERQLATYQFGIRISPEGEYLGLVELDEILAAVRALDPSKGEEIAQFLADPEVRPMIEQAAGKPWQAWVGAWNGLALAPGEYETEVVHDIGGVAITESLHYEHLGYESGYVRLRYDGTIVDPQFGLAIFEMVDSMIPDAKKKLEAGEIFEQMDVRRDVIIEALVRPESLVPAWVRMTENIRIAAGEEKQERFESHEWTFTVATE